MGRRVGGWGGGGGGGGGGGTCGLQIEMEIEEERKELPKATGRFRESIHYNTSEVVRGPINL